MKNKDILNLLKRVEKLQAFHSDDISEEDSYLYIDLRETIAELTEKVGKESRKLFNYNITIGGKTFVNHDKVFDGTIKNVKIFDGMYDIKTNHILFYDVENNLFAALIANNHNERFFVNCGWQNDRKIHFMFSTSHEANKKLGIAGISYSEEQEIAKNIWNFVSGNGE